MELARKTRTSQPTALFQYLENHNMAKILAQPRLLANTGEKAKFLSGGEIPIVIAQALNTSIVFKEFGTKVTFVPTVVGVNEVELLVQPEVSEPDYAHGVQLFGFQVPAFVTRRAETQVRLHDNQTLIIAGLILHEKKQIVGWTARSPSQLKSLARWLEARPKNRRIHGIGEAGARLGA